DDGIRYRNVTGVQTCALPISHGIAVVVLGEGRQLRDGHRERPVSEGLELRGRRAVLRHLRVSPGALASCEHERCDADRTGACHELLHRSLLIIENRDVYCITSYR